MKNEASLKEIGNNIQIARLKKINTKKHLLKKCNVSAKYISAMERGFHLEVFHLLLIFVIF